MGNQQQTTSFEAFAHNTMMKTETIALLMAALLALSAVTHPVMAQDSDDPDEDTDETDFRDAERKLEVEHSNDEIKVESKREDNTSEDKLVVKAYAEDGKDFRLRLKYETETETGDVETSAEAKMRLRFSEIIEFVGDAADGYTGEPVLSSYAIDTYDAFTAFEQDNNIYTTSVATADGVFGVVIRFTEAVADIDAVTLSPTSVKFDVLITDFPYEGTAGTSLALRTQIDTEAERSEERAMNEVDAGFVSFSWEPTVTADGLAVDIVPSAMVDVSSGDDDGSDSDEATSEEADEDADDEADESSRETSSMMWFSIDASAKPSAIVWDPVTGLSANPLSGASAAASLSLAVVLSAVLVAAFAM